MEISKTHWRSVDYRRNSLVMVLGGLQATINELHEVVKQGGWYDGIWFQEDAEPIYGLGLIALQHYINGSIKDRFGIVKGKEQYYSTASVIDGYSKSGIELIVNLANYSKHKEEHALHSPTKKCLEHFGLNCSTDADLNDSPIFTGMDLLSKEWDLHEVAKDVFSWRESLWNSD